MHDWPITVSCTIAERVEMCRAMSIWAETEYFEPNRAFSGDEEFSYMKRTFEPILSLSEQKASKVSSPTAQRAPKVSSLSSLTAQRASKVSSPTSSVSFLVYLELKEQITPQQHWLAKSSYRWFNGCRIPSAWTRCATSRSGSPPATSRVRPSARSRTPARSPPGSCPERSTDCTRAWNVRKITLGSSIPPETGFPPSSSRRAVLQSCKIIIIITIKPCDFFSFS